MYTFHVFVTRNITFFPKCFSFFVYGTGTLYLIDFAIVLYGKLFCFILLLLL